MRMLDMNQVWLILSWLFVIYAFTSAIYILLQNRQPEITLAWLLIFFILPVVGVIVYVFFGRDQKPFARTNQLAKQTATTSPSGALARLLEEQEAIMQRIGSVDDIPPNHRRLIRLLYRTRLSLLTLHNDVEILQDASTKYPRLIEDIEQAKHSIHMEYFIWQADDYMQEFGDLLIRKAQEGVQVRILFDAVGSMALNLWRRDYIRRLRRGGVQIYAYLNFLSPFYLHTLNFRNHRKIAVIDGKIGYTGGLNMGKEHLVGAGPYKAWRDTHLRLTGGSVAVLQAIFATSWYNTTRQELTDPAYFCAVEDRPKTLPIQIVVSGPDSQWDSIQQLYFLMILAAEHHVYIQSPFFIPDRSVADALKTAALSGVDVRLMCARRDTGGPIANWAANTYFLDMVRAGVKVYLYQPGYLHAKTMSIDGSICTVGTANMDLRSFNVNYEINTVLYDQEVAAKLEADFLRDLEGCTEFSAQDYRRRNPVLRLRDSVARLLSPVL